MAKALREALVAEVFAAMESANAALEMNDMDTAKAALARARDARSMFWNADAAAAPSASQRRRRTRGRPASSSNGGRRQRGGGRVPVAKRREEILELLHRSEKPLSKHEIADRLGTTPEVVTRATRTIDEELLEVVKGQGREPSRYTLASQRKEEVSA